MKKTEEFNNILDECLGQVLVKGETIKQCLMSYPTDVQIDKWGASTRLPTILPTSPSTTLPQGLLGRFFFTTG